MCVAVAVAHPPAQVEYASRLQAACGKGGACLVGNAVDVAPPCLAQGINSAINDVAALHEAIEAGMAVEDEEGQKIGSCIADILAAYEKSHLRCEQVRCPHHVWRCQMPCRALDAVVSAMGWHMHKGSSSSSSTHHIPNAA